MMKHIDKLETGCNQIRAEVDVIQRDMEKVERRLIKVEAAANQITYHWHVTRALAFMCCLLLGVILKDRILGPASGEEFEMSGESNPFVVIAMFIGLPMLAHACFSYYLAATSEQSDSGEKETVDMNLTNFGEELQAELQKFEDELKKPSMSSVDEDYATLTFQVDEDMDEP